MQASLRVNRRAASVPSLLLLQNQACVGPYITTEVLGLQEKTSHACFSPVFDLELDAKLASSNHLDRCFSHQQLGGEVAAGSSLLQQIVTLCRCVSPFQAQLLQHVQQWRSCACAASGCSSPAAALPGCSGHSLDVSVHSGVVQPGSSMQDAAEPGSSMQAAAAPLDMEALACELLALGFMVQVRDGAQQQERGRTPRSCLQTLRHRFIVCLGVRNSADGEPCYLPEPLVVEPCFREQFTIAHPTQEYEALLQSVPRCFVGPAANLEGVVKLICDQMVATFKLQGLPVPPWRTRTALLSKWSPTQLAELAAKITSLQCIAARLPPLGGPIAPCQSHEQLFNDDRPAAAHSVHAAVGSAPLGVMQLHAAVDGAAVVPWEQQQRQTARNTCAGNALGGSQQTVACPAAGAMQPPDLATTRTTTASQLKQRVPMQQVVGTTMSRGTGNGALGISTTGGPSIATPVLEPVPTSVGGVLGETAMLPSNNCAAPRGAALKFTRKASAEWKHQRHTSRKIKGLLAAALQKPVSGSRGSLFAATTPEPGSVHPDGQLADTPKALGSCGNADTQLVGPPVAVGGVEPGSAALIRRTHYRAGCDEPWRRITTVRLGAYQHHKPVLPQP